MRNIAITHSGKLEIGEEFLAELRQAFTNEQIDGAVGVIVSGDTTSDVREITVEKSRYRSAGVPGSAWLKLENGRLRPTVAP